MKNSFFLKRLVFVILVLIAVSGVRLFSAASVAVSTLDGERSKLKGTLKYFEEIIRRQKEENNAILTRLSESEKEKVDLEEEISRLQSDDASKQEELASYLDLEPERYEDAISSVKTTRPAELSTVLLNGKQTVIPKIPEHKKEEQKDIERRQQEAKGGLTTEQHDTLQGSGPKGFSEGSMTQERKSVEAGVIVSQPLQEVERLRDENTRLREEVRRLSDSKDIAVKNPTHEQGPQTTNVPQETDVVGQSIKPTDVEQKRNERALIEESGGDKIESSLPSDSSALTSNIPPPPPLPTKAKSQGGIPLAPPLPGNIPPPPPLPVKEQRGVPRATTSESREGYLAEIQRGVKLKPTGVKSSGDMVSSKNQQQSLLSGISAQREKVSAGSRPVNANDLQQKALERYNQVSNVTSEKLEARKRLEATQTSLTDTIKETREESITLKKELENGLARYLDEHSKRDFTFHPKDGKDTLSFSLAIDHRGRAIHKEDGSPEVGSMPRAKDLYRHREELLNAGILTPEAVARIEKILQHDEKLTKEERELHQVKDQIASLGLPGDSLGKFFMRLKAEGKLPEISQEKMQGLIQEAEKLKAEKLKNPSLSEGQRLGIEKRPLEEYLLQALEKEYTPRNQVASGLRSIKDDIDELGKKDKGENLEGSQAVIDEITEVQSLIEDSRKLTLFYANLDSSQKLRLWQVIRSWQSLAMPKGHSMLFQSLQKDFPDTFENQPQVWLMAYLLCAKYKEDYKTFVDAKDGILSNNQSEPVELSEEEAQKWILNLKAKLSSPANKIFKKGKIELLSAVIAQAYREKLSEVALLMRHKPDEHTKDFSSTSTGDKTLQVERKKPENALSSKSPSREQPLTDKDGEMLLKLEELSREKQAKENVEQELAQVRQEVKSVKEALDSVNQAKNKAEQELAQIKQALQLAKQSQQEVGNERDRLLREIQNLREQLQEAKRSTREETQVAQQKGNIPPAPPLPGNIPPPPPLPKKGVEQNMPLTTPSSTTGEREDLLAAIRKGTTLRSTTQSQSSHTKQDDSPSQSATNTELLSAIRKAGGKAKTSGGSFNYTEFKGFVKQCFEISEGVLTEQIIDALKREFDKLPKAKTAEAFVKTSKGSFEAFADALFENAPVKEQTKLYREFGWQFGDVLPQMKRKAMLKNTEEKLETSPVSERQVEFVHLLVTAIKLELGEEVEDDHGLSSKTSKSKPSSMQEMMRKAMEQRSKAMRGEGEEDDDNDDW